MGMPACGETTHDPLPCSGPNVGAHRHSGVELLSARVAERPGLRHLLVHNIDTLGTDLDPALLGLHLEGGKALTFELITRRIEDRGGDSCMGVRG